MHGYIPRFLFKEVIKGLKNNPVVAILGLRQSGKTELSKQILAENKGAVYLDLELPSDRNKLQDPEAFLEYNKDYLICLDEIQRVPEIFEVIRSKVDASKRMGQFLILGSASQDLIKQSSETLAGRIAYYQLYPITLPEIAADKLYDLWNRGGLPRSLLASDDEASYEWRLNYIKTFIERDIPQLGFTIPSVQIERFWRFAAHYHGNIFNASEIGKAMGLNYKTIQSYMYILEQTFTIRLLEPYFNNSKKRLVKSPKLYIRDSGILHALLKAEDYNDLLGRQNYGASWEGFVIENILDILSKWKGSFYRTSNGAEIDLLLERKNKKIAIECKASSAPQPTRGFYSAIEDLNVDESYVIAPINDEFVLQNGTVVTSLSGFLGRYVD